MRLRGQELLHWGEYLNSGGTYQPMHFFAPEYAPPAKPGETASAAAGGGSKPSCVSM
jgi:hypothetical protein